jgi:hypothetical protein
VLVAGKTVPNVGVSMPGRNYTFASAGRHLKFEACGDGTGGLGGWLTDMLPLGHRLLLMELKCCHVMTLVPLSLCILCPSSSSPAEEAAPVVPSTY